MRSILHEDILFTIGVLPRGIEMFSSTFDYSANDNLAEALCKSALPASIVHAGC